MDSELEIKRNKSLTYVLPVFAKFVPIQYFRLLENTYLWYDNDVREETFCLLYRFDGKIKGSVNTRQGFTVYEQRVLHQSEYFVGSTDYGEYVIFKFNMPEELFELRNLFIEGKYSKYSDDHKIIILEFILQFYGPNEKLFIERIFFKDPELRDELLDMLGPSTRLPPDAELSSAPYLENEIFVYSLTEKEIKNESKRIF